MVKLDLIIGNRLVTLLANLPIAANDLQHHIARYGPRVSPSFFGLSEGFCGKEDRTDMSEYAAASVCHDTWNLIWIVIPSVGSYHELEKLSPI